MPSCPKPMPRNGPMAVAMVTLSRKYPRPSPLLLWGRILAMMSLVHVLLMPYAVPCRNLTMYSTAIDETKKYVTDMISAIDSPRISIFFLPTISTYLPRVTLEISPPMT